MTHSFMLHIYFYVSRVGVYDTLSDSNQCLNFAKNDSFNIRFNLPKIHFKMLFNSKKILLIQFNRYQFVHELFHNLFFQKIQFKN